MQTYEKLPETNNSEVSVDTQITVKLQVKEPTFSVSSTELKHELKLCDSLKTLLSQNAINEKSLKKSTSKASIPKVSVPLKLLTTDELDNFVAGATENLDAVLRSQVDSSVKQMNVWRSKRLLYDYCLSEIVKFSTMNGLKTSDVAMILTESYKDLHADFPTLIQDLKPSRDDEIGEVPYSQTIHAERGHHKFSFQDIRTSFESFLKKFVPFWLKEYNLEKLKGDLIAGVTVGVMSVPQGMAYAIIAGLPPIYGLYSSTVPLLIYAVLGSSRELAIGPFALVSLLVYSAVSPFAAPQTPEFISLVTVTSFFVGTQMILLGLFRIGFVVNFLSHPVLDGFNTAAACIIAASQLPSLFGFSSPRTSEFYLTLYNFFTGMKNTSLWSLLLGVACIAILYGIKKVNALLKKKGVVIPGPIVVLLLGLGLSYGLDLENWVGMHVVGTIPQGFPPVSIPSQIDWPVARSLFLDSFFISLVAFTSSISVSKKYADEKKYSLDSNQELVALGLSNIIGGFFSSYPVSGSLSRTVVNATSGAATQMASIIAVIIVFFSLLFLTPVLYFIPHPVLASIVIMAVLGLVDFNNIRDFWKIKKVDLLLWIVALLSTLVVGIGNGIIVSVLFSMIMVFYRSTRPHTAILGRLPGSVTYRNVHRFPSALVVPGLIILRLDDSLFFANVSFFKDKLEQIQNAESLDVVVLDFSSVNDIDSTACKVFREIIKELHKHDILLLISTCKGIVWDIMKRAGLVKEIGKEHFFWELHDAVRYGSRRFRRKKGLVVEDDSDDDIPYSKYEESSLDEIEMKPQSAMYSRLVSHPQEEEL